MKKSSVAVIPIYNRGSVVKYFDGHALQSFHYLTLPEYKRHSVNLILISNQKFDGCSNYTWKWGFYRRNEGLVLCIDGLFASIQAVYYKHRLLKHIINRKPIYIQVI